MAERRNTRGGVAYLMVYHCKPQGYFTKGKGASRVVHPICGRGAGIGSHAHRVRKAMQYAKKHSLKLGEPIMVPSLDRYQRRVQPGTGKHLLSPLLATYPQLRRVPKHIIEKLLADVKDSTYRLDFKVEGNSVKVIPREGPMAGQTAGLYNFTTRTPTLKTGKLQRKEKARERLREKAVKGEAGLNLRTTGDLARRYPGRVSLIMEQAQAAYHYQHPEAFQTAEPYELLEGGFVDEALDSLGLRR